MPVRTSELGIKVVVTDALTQNYLKKLSRQTYIATAIVIFVSVVSLIWLLFHFGGKVPVARSTLLVFYSNSMYALVSFVAATWCFQTVYRATRWPVRLSPRLQ